MVSYCLDLYPWSTFPIDEARILMFDDEFISGDSVYLFTLWSHHFFEQHMNRLYAKARALNTDELTTSQSVE
jgi:branched-subunit amino acid aminotransferase/4-amino-4-deoxychorismate lyase